MILRCGFALGGLLALALVFSAPHRPGAAEGAARRGGSRPLLPAKSLTRELHAALSNLSANAAADPGDRQAQRALGTDAAMVALLAHLAAEGAYGNAVPWSLRAAELRRLGGRMIEVVDASDPRRAEELRRLVSEARRLTSGGKASGGAPPDKPPGVSELVERGWLMWRMDRSLKWIKDHVDGRDALADERDRLAHEVAVLGALAELIGSDGYYAVDEGGFQSRRRALAEAAVGIARAAQGNDAAAVQAARTTARQSCKDCHGEYRN